MRLLSWSILCFGLITAEKLLHAARTGRVLAFQKGSTFFECSDLCFQYRMNYKINSVSYSTIFAQASGFKVVWELPSGPGKIGRATRSIHDVHEGAELLYESHGFNGRSCLLKKVCQALEYVSARNGVIGKILKLLAGPYINNGTTSTESLYCGAAHVRNCPLELIGLDGFMKG